MARESAARGEFADALEWLTVLGAIGEELSDEDRARSEEWRSALAAERAAPDV